MQSPFSSAALCDQAVGLHRQGLLEDAERLYRRVAEGDPAYAACRHLLGVIRHQQGRDLEALELIGVALTLKPDYREALVNQGTVLKTLGRAVEALRSYDGALALDDDALAWNGRGAALLDLDQYDAALGSFERALALKPGFPQAMANRGRVLEYLGRLDEARQSYAQALAADPGVAHVYLDYADLTKMTPGDPLLAAMTALRQSVTGDTDKIHLDFALAKAHADLGDHPASFDHLRSANVLKRAQISYDEAAMMGVFDRIEDVMSADFLRVLQRLSPLRQTHPQPIFILGMMRSGSTLVEQILASHARVHGAGELPALSAVAGSVAGPDGVIRPYPECVPALDGSGLADIGARYLALLRQAAPGAVVSQASHVTDKMPSNFFLAGLIHLTLPGARIIHTVRDPVDTCVSCFSKLFIADHPHTYDLGELGRYYRRYQGLMAHWHRVLPPGRILEHCGLEWDPGCLAFHENRRPVRTASVSQVRRKIYGEAVGRAHVHDAFLGPLRQALGDII